MFLPKSMGGPDTRINLVDLTSREHFIAHKCLTRFTVGEAKEKAWCAVHCMAFCGRYDNITSADYARAGVEHAKAVSESNRRDLARPERSKRAAIKQWSGETGERRRKSQGDMMKKYLASLDKDDPFFHRLRGQSRFANYRNSSRRENMVEFYGSYYFGFRSRFDHTGCSRDHYERYHLNGINPSFRSGVDGPLRFSDIEVMIDIVRSKNEDISHEIEDVLSFMVDSGIISEYAMKSYLNRKVK